MADLLHTGFHHNGDFIAGRADLTAKVEDSNFLMPAPSLNGSFDAADDFLQVIYGFGEVGAGLVCLFIAFALLLFSGYVAVLFLLSLEVFEAAFQLLQLVDDALQIFAWRILFMVSPPPHSLLQSGPR